jgi:hypothetical protein
VNEAFVSLVPDYSFDCFTVLQRGAVHGLRRYLQSGGPKDECYTIELGHWLNCLARSIDIM